MPSAAREEISSGGCRVIALVPCFQVCRVDGPPQGIRMLAGLDASFVLTGSQALKKPASRWSRLGEANRAIGCVVTYRFPEMEEMERAHAILPLDFPYVPGLLSFREI